MSFLRSWITHVEPRSGISIKAAESSGETTAAFLTTDSLASFSGASVAVVAIWRVLQAVFKPAEGLGPFDYLVVPLVLSFMWAAFTYYIAVSAKKSKLKDPGERIKAIGIGIVNAFFLTATVIGIDTTLG